MPGLRADPDACGRCFRRGFAGFLAMAGLPDSMLEGYLLGITALLMDGHPPPIAGSEAWRALRRDSGNPDIFSAEKRFFTESLLGVLPELRKKLLESHEPLMAALSAATWCNAIDSAQGKSIPSPSELLKTFGMPLAVDDRGEFTDLLPKAGTLLVIGDNAGETVLDRLFLELSGFTGKVLYMVRPLPVMNDATRQDAEMAGLADFAEILDSGSDLPSVVPELLSPEAAMVFQRSDLILAKGQGNLEGLWGLLDPRLFHSFVVKCPVISKATGLPEGCGVFVSSVRLEEKECPYTSTTANPATQSSNSS